MLNLPRATDFGRRVDKKKFYENRPISSDLKDRLIAEVESVRWQNKLSPQTINVAPGKNVCEIQVFEIVIKENTLSKAVFEYIDRAIPYHNVFVVGRDGRASIRMAYKEDSQTGAGAVAKSHGYFETPQCETHALELKIEGIDMDAVYAGFLRQVAGTQLSCQAGDVRTAVERAERRARLEKELAAVEKKAGAEKQPRRRFEYFKKAQSLREAIRDCEEQSQLRHCEERSDVAISCDSGAEKPEKE